MPTRFLLLVVVVVAIGLVAGCMATSGVKSQNMRLVDVFFLGPLMIYAGSLTKELGGLARWLLIFFGASTITYNGKNWLREHGK